MDILLPILVACFATGVSAICLWMAMRIVRVDGSFGLLLLASAIAALVGLIPMAGPLLSFAVLIFLLYKWTDMDNWLQALLMVVIARGLAMVGAITLIQLMR